MKQKIVIISGPTAVGKTGLSIDLAKKFNGEIISADSVQVYRGADIGSAKITNAEMNGIKHHLIDIIEPDGEFNAGRFSELARQEIANMASRGKLPIIVGGTGLYISALLFPLTTSAERDDNLRNQLLTLAQTEGQTALYSKLQEIDPTSAQNIHPHQTDRIIRAIEIFLKTGVKKSEMTQEKESDFDYLLIVLNTDRDCLYDQINKRVEKMIEAGLIEEVDGLIKKYNLNQNSQIMQGIGYKETAMYLAGEIDKKQMIDLIKQRSRNYAKRQLTWFKKMPNAVFVDRAEISKVPTLVKNFLGENNE